MRLLFITAVLSLTISFSTVQAQNAAENDGQLRVGSRSRFQLSDIDEKVIKKLNGAWQQCVLGTMDTEAVVLVLREPGGSIKPVLAGRTNQSYKFTFIWNPATIAVIHTHPNNRDPRPEPQDIQIARKFDVPMFTITRRGMYMYDPVTDRISRVKDGIDWLDSSSWTRGSNLAVNKP